MHSTSLHGSVTWNSFSKTLVWIHNFGLYPFVSADALKAQWKKNRDGYIWAIEKREEQTRLGVAKTKLATCRHFSLLGFLHSVVSSQNADSNANINFWENKTDGQEAVKAPQICTLSEESSNQRSNPSSHKGLGKRSGGESIDPQLVESLNNVNDAIKTIVGQIVSPSQNDEIDTDMHFCESLVSSLKALSPKRNRLTRV